MRSTNRERDEWLALRCQAHVPGALEDLITEMERPLFYYLTKLAGSQDKACDTLQEVWLRTLPAIRKLKDPSVVRAWLYRIAHAASVDSLRRQHTRERAEETYLEITEFDIDFDATDAAAVHQALDRIDFKHREVLVLFFLEDFSLNEIAGILDCPAGTVKSRLFYAKRALRDVLTGDTHAHVE